MRALAWMSLSYDRNIESETERRFSPMRTVLRCYKLRDIPLIQPRSLSASCAACRPMWRGSGRRHGSHTRLVSQSADPHLRRLSLSGDTLHHVIRWNVKKSGGKVQSSATRPGVNRAAQALRLAAKNLQRSQSALGAVFRRMAARRGLAKAITATAYKLARIIYTLLKHGMAYVAQGLAAYETAYRERVVRQVKRKAAELGLVVVEQHVVEQLA